jgi:hypothetical protein
MNLKTRLEKLEQNFLIESIEPVEEVKICEHPASMFKLYRCYPAKGHSDRRLVVKGHCNVCGFDDYLWSFYALTDEQETRRQELIYASDFWGSQAYDLELIKAGLISYALFPPTPEVQMRFTGKVSI